MSLSVPPDDHNVIGVQPQTPTPAAPPTVPANEQDSSSSSALNQQAAQAVAQNVSNPDPMSVQIVALQKQVEALQEQVAALSATFTNHVHSLEGMTGLPSWGTESLQDLKDWLTNSPYAGDLSNATFACNVNPPGYVTPTPESYTYYTGGQTTAPPPTPD